MMFLKLGIVGRALGIQGSFYVSGRDEPIPPKLKTVLIGKSVESAKAAEIIQVGWQAGRPFIKCSLAGDRTQAELLVGLAIWIDESLVEVKNDQEYLLSDLRGRTVEDCTGHVVGTVVDVVVWPASVNIVVVNESRDQDVDIPMIPAYVDMNFERGAKTLKLAVPADTFSEIWNKRK